eukprot:TRINITY_DN4981_c1_g1_i2.p1 TRINITY_DN4981_c1_g1~~TRINITY_DN4981_c1_g1_i2.p1  ORF type:complete len:275 (-),score=33.63 TRINITY_DN4981_c1_g1_i2:112-936(-)
MRYVGYLGGISGTGIIIGSFLSGVICNYSVELAVYISCAIYLLSIPVIYLLLPSDQELEPFKIKSSSTYKNTGKDISWRESLSIITVDHTQLRNIILLYSLFNLGGNLFRSNFSLLLAESDVSTSENGYIMSYIGVISLLANMFIIPRITLNSKKMVQVGSMIGCITMIIYSFITMDMKRVIVILIPIMVANLIISSAVTTDITKLAPQELIGGVLGVKDSIGSICKIISPLIGGLLIEYGCEALLLSVAIVYFTIALFVTITKVLEPNKKKQE